MILATFVVVVVIVAITNHISTRLNLVLTREGCINLAAICAISAWYVLDALVPRRRIYSWLGQREDTLKHLVRFWRRVLLLSCVLGAIIAAIDSLVLVDKTLPLNAQAVAPIAILVGAYLAAFGWMYTRFEQDKADRAKATFEAIREHLYGPVITATYRDIVTITQYLTKSKNIDKNEPLPADVLNWQLGHIPLRNQLNGHSSTSLSEALAFYFNALDQLAFGVRRGEMDLRTIEMILRQRIIRSAMRYFHFIAKQTDAQPVDERKTRFQAQTRSLEHFLWLLSHLDVFETDDVRYQHLILPPSASAIHSKLERPKLA